MQQKKLIQLIQVPKIFDDCYLCFAQRLDHIPFPIKRVYYIFEASTKLPRGLHAHKKTKQVLFCIQRSVKITMDDGRKRGSIILNQPDIGVFIDKMVWHEMRGFKKDTVLLILASTLFDQNDYIRDYDEFKKIKQGKH